MSVSPTTVYTAKCDFCQRHEIFNTVNASVEFLRTSGKFLYESSYQHSQKRDAWACFNCCATHPTVRAALAPATPPRDTAGRVAELEAELAAVKRERDELQASMDKLPKTRDGIICSGGEMLFDEHGDEWIVAYSPCNDRLNRIPGGGWTAWHHDGAGAVAANVSCDIQLLYSTFEAAQSAGQREGGAA